MRTEYFTIFSAILKKIRTDVNEEYQHYYSALLSNDKDFKPEDYTKWNIITDETVNCNIDNSSKFYNTEIIKSLYYFPLEIVSPKLQYYIGTEVYRDIWENVIMLDDFQYFTNKSQGLHINLSHPKMKAGVFIYIWNEIIGSKIISNLPKYRQKKLDTYAISYKNRPYQYSRMSSYEYAKQKHVPVGLRIDDDGNERIEIRVYHSTMDIDEISEWLEFCVYLLAIFINYHKNLDIITVDLIRKIIPENIRHFIK